MKTATRAQWPNHPWIWPALLGGGNVFALVAALVADGSVGWDSVCWVLLLAPAAVVIRALWRGGIVTP